MNQTLFYLPHVLFEGWLLAAWVVIGILIFGYQLWVAKSGKEALNFVPMFLIVAGIIYFVLPRLEIMGINPEDPTGAMIPIGLAIRGYGFCMLLAILAGVGLALFRCRQVGFDAEKILPVAFWMIIAGLIGARLFYVIQKWETFPASMETSDKIFSLLDMTKGGLVVYGSLIGGTVALVVYLRVKNLSWQVADILAPGMVIGLCIGRIGCLMNGCCYGGVCEADYPGLAFPPASPPYMHQLANGSLLGLGGSLTEKGALKVESVTPGSLADTRGIKVGDEVVLTRLPDSIRLRALKENGLELDAPVQISSANIGVIEISGNDLPAASLKVHPTQVYSSINAFLLFLVVWFYFPFRRHRGEVYAWMLILYSIGRFMLEIIRTGEAGQFGTGLTISQWISFMTISVGFALLIYFRSQSGGDPAEPKLSSGAAAV